MEGCQASTVCLILKTKVTSSVFKTQSVPRSKHTPSQFKKPVS